MTDDEPDEPPIEFNRMMHEVHVYVEHSGRPGIHPEPTICITQSEVSGEDNKIDLDPAQVPLVIDWLAAAVIAVEQWQAERAAEKAG